MTIDASGIPPDPGHSAGSPRANATSRRKTNHAGRDDLQHDRLRTLNEIGRVVSATLDLDRLYETIYEQVGRVMDTSQLFLALLRPGQRVVDLAYHREEGTLLPRSEAPLGTNVTSLVIETGTPLLFRSHAEYQAFASTHGLPELTIGRHSSESKAWVPLNTGNRTIGALSVQSRRVDAYTPDDLQMLSVIASQAAVAIENARLYRRSQENVRQTQALLHVAQTVNGSLDLQTVLDSILAGMREVIPYYLAAVLLPDERNGWLDVVGVVGPLAEERRQTIKIPFGRGITGRVFQSGQPLNVPNVFEFADYVSHGLNEVHSKMALPLKRGETVVGVLDIQREEIGAFSDDDLDLMRLFASQAAIAIENARLFAEQRQRVFELQTIQSIVQRLTTQHEAATIADTVNRELKHLVDYHALRIFSPDEDARALVPIAIPGESGPDVRLKLGEGLAGWAAQTGQSAIVANTLTDDRVVQIPGTPQREESMIAVPLTYQGRVRGVMTLSKLGRDQFDENALRLLEIISAQTAIAFDRAMLYDKLRNDAITDTVTRIYNRRYLFERLREEKSRAVRNKHSLIALMLDIDKFKRVNDTYGHDAGDCVLEELARLIRAVVRAEDLVARYGGEEFCVLLPEIPLPDAINVAERLRRIIARHRMPVPAGVKHITVSVGVSALAFDDQGQEIFTRADTAMYSAKRLGGNRVVVFADGETRFPDAEPGEARSD